MKQLNKERNTIEQLHEMSVEDLLSLLPNNLYTKHDLSDGGNLTIVKCIDETYEVGYQSHRGDKKISEMPPLFTGRYRSLKLGLIETYFKAQAIINRLNP